MVRTIRNLPPVTISLFVVYHAQHFVLLFIGHDLGPLLYHLERRIIAGHLCKKFQKSIDAERPPQKHML